MNKNSIKRTLSFALITAFVLFGTVGTSYAQFSTPYVATTNVQMGPGPIVLCSAITGKLRIGDRDGIMPKSVTILQNFLYKKGFLPVPPTGYFGTLTRQAVITFQAQNGLVADGIVGVQTEAHIIAVDCPPNGMPITGAPTISAITPMVASSGSMVTIIGSGFNNTSVVHFAIGGITNGVVGNNGTTLSFVIPSNIGPYCTANQICALYLMLVNNGTYPVYVQNADGSVSNTVQFTVAGNPNLVIPTAN